MIILISEFKKYLEDYQATSDFKPDMLSKSEIGRLASNGLSDQKTENTPGTCNDINTAEQPKTIKQFPGFERLYDFIDDPNPKYAHLQLAIFANDTVYGMKIPHIRLRNDDDSELFYAKMLIYGYIANTKHRSARFFVRLYTQQGADTISFITEPKLTEDKMYEIVYHLSEVIQDIKDNDTEGVIDLAWVTKNNMKMRN